MLFRNGQGAFWQSICDSVPAVGRWHLLLLGLAATLGFSGCLLFAGPINKAPTVTVSTPVKPYYRGQPLLFWATVKDDHDDTATLQLRWHEFNTNANCLEFASANWPSDILTSAVNSPFSFTPTDPNLTSCVCAQVTDSKGAQGYGCASPITAENPVPIVRIVDESGGQSGDTRRLCSSIKLSADVKLPGNVSVPAGDTLEYEWRVRYSGSYSAGKSPQFSPCDADKKGVEQCLYGVAPGTYTVSLRVIDNGDTSTAGVASDFEIVVAEDQPPCLERTDPDVYAQRILLSRSGDLSGTYQSRSLKAINVDDDCEPYPQVSGSTGESQFFWFVFDPTSSANPSWVRQTEATNTFVVSSAKFPNARPGDVIKVRLEVRDKAHPSVPGVQICADTTDICCGPNGCKGTNDCVRWTTWAVQFQP
jgi:hypothetical protein